LVVIKRKHKTIRINVDETLYNEFVNNVTQIEGYKKGRQGIGLEKAMRLYINYCKPYHDKMLIEVAKEHDMEVWEVGQRLISRFMQLHNELGVGLDYMTNDEHFELVKKHLNRDKN